MSNYVKFQMVHPTSIKGGGRGAHYEISRIQLAKLGDTLKKPSPTLHA